MTKLLESKWAKLLSCCCDSLDEWHGVEMLAEDEACELWDEKVGSGPCPDFGFPDGSWLKEGEWVSIGNWIEPYNQPDLGDEIIQRMGVVGEWRDDEELVLIISRNQAFVFGYQWFGVHWRNLLCVFDDAPLLLSRKSKRNAFTIAPMGAVLHMAG